MLEELLNSSFFGLVLSLVAWLVGRWAQKKTGWVLCNPLLVAVLLIIGFLLVTGIPYASYAVGGSVIRLMLGPVTVILALNIYNQRQILGRHFVPVVAGCLMGSLTSLVSVTLLCRLFQLEEVLAASMLPKSCTAAIAIGIAESRGGVAGIAVAGVMITGLTGALLAPLFAKLFRITDPVAEGVAVGACSHAIGTSRAMEIGRVQGAMSSVAICVCGILSSIIVIFF